jgi:hypothetical protein
MNNRREFITLVELLRAVLVGTDPFLNDRVEQIGIYVALGASLWGFMRRLGTRA